MAQNIPLKLRDWIDKSKFIWVYLSKNPNAISILEKNMDKVNWIHLSKNPNAIHLLETNMDKINWIELSMNPNAISILEKNQDKLSWYWLYRNPSIFVYDYASMRENHRDLKEELMRTVWHPSRVSKWLEAGIDIDDL